MTRREQRVTEARLYLKLAFQLADLKTQTEQEEKLKQTLITQYRREAELAERDES